MAGLQIGSPDQDDLGGFIRLIDDAFVSGKGRQISLQVRFPDLFAPANRENLLVCKNGTEILGGLAMGDLRWRDGDEIFHGVMIGAVCIHPDHRGAGLGSRLLDRAAARIGAKRADFAVLWATRQSFYARLGWQCADSAAVAEIVPDHQAAWPAARVEVASPADWAETLDLQRLAHLGAAPLRSPDIYRRLPLPSESVWLYRTPTAYALAGQTGTTGYVYEMIGDPAQYDALWQALAAGKQRVIVNTHLDSPTCRWLADRIGTAAARTDQAMWLPAAHRLDVARCGQWQVPYLDRI